MADAGPSTSGAPAAAPPPAAAAPPPRAPFRPAKFGTYERQVVDYVRTATAKNVWYYRDRLSVPRGPCSLPVLREAWANGVIDEHTLVWGQGLADWLPARNVRTLVPQVRTLEVQVATWVKKTFALRPALARARAARAAERPEPTNAQVDTMY
jgi:hypothetical protein